MRQKGKRLAFIRTSSADRRVGKHAETPESFAERYKADRLRELEKEYRVADALDAARPELRLITELARRLTYGQ